MAQQTDNQTPESKGLQRLAVGTKLTQVSPEEASGLHRLAVGTLYPDPKQAKTTQEELLSNTSGNYSTKALSEKGPLSDASPLPLGQPSNPLQSVKQPQEGLLSNTTGNYSTKALDTKGQFSDAAIFPAGTASNSHQNVTHHKTKSATAGKKVSHSTDAHKLHGTGKKLPDHAQPSSTTPAPAPHHFNPHERIERSLQTPMQMGPQ